MHEDQVVPAGQEYPAMADAGWLPAEKPDGSPPRPWASDSALDALRNLAKKFSSPRQPLWCPASLMSQASGTAQIFRAPGQSMHVVGASPLAAELRRLLTDGAEPGWELHPVPGGATPLHALAAPLRRLSGTNRFYNLLDRSGFAYVEEVAATPEECLTDLRNGGPRFVAAVRQAISELAAADDAASETSFARFACMTIAAPVPGLEPAFDVRATLGPLEDHGMTRAGHRRVVPILSGQVTGLFDAQILSGGADWQLVRSDGAVEIDTRYSARTPTGEYVHFRTSGVRSGPPEILEALLRGEPVDPSQYYFRVVVHLETSAPRLAALQQSIFVASAVREADRIWYTAYRVS